MNRIVVAAVAVLLLAAAALFWWQGTANSDAAAVPAMPAITATASPEDLPTVDGSGLRGPVPPEVDEPTREQRRFDGIDHNRDGRIARNEFLALRAVDFRKLDTTRDELLSFDEWAVHSGDRFRAADINGDGWLTRQEFVATRSKPSARPHCGCAQIHRRTIDPATREQRRFDRVDRDRDGRVTRNEFLALRTAAFRKLDTDRNNLLSFEEWAVRSSGRFRTADANQDGWLSREEFATTRPRRSGQTQCRCPATRPASAHRRAAESASPADEPDADGEVEYDSVSDEEGGEPGA